MITEEEVGSTASGPRHRAPSLPHQDLDPKRPGSVISDQWDPLPFLTSPVHAAQPNQNPFCGH
ncbi:hypothetical protein KFK09_006356 [Dendrobium nobile]|uniref:Uncharacterized protein n=1 Tax=Dendrobium nobile TaxID=94219 RepID=A0A8T3BRE7_DENNO|nr:hypothetical protein KFK09_006356 [Dendrobium nobile]